MCANGRVRLGRKITMRLEVQKCMFCVAVRGLISTIIVGWQIGTIAILQAEAVTTASVCAWVCSFGGGCEKYLCKSSVFFQENQFLKEKIQLLKEQKPKS